MGLFVSVLSQVGPLLHMGLSDSSISGVIPLVGMSAGFSLPQQWSQQLGNVSRCISFTRFWTNGRQSLPVLLIQKYAIFESMKHFGSISSTLVERLLDTVVINWASSSADNSSSLGIVSWARGATLVFAATKLDDLWLLVSATKYTTAAYAAVEASQKPYKEQSPVLTVLK